MKYILILSVILFSCSSSKVVVQDARITVKGGRVSIKPFGPAEKMPDTVMVIKLIRRL